MQEQLLEILLCIVHTLHLTEEILVERTVMLIALWEEPLALQQMVIHFRVLLTCMQEVKRVAIIFAVLYFRKDLSELIKHRTLWLADSITLKLLLVLEP
jgi:hypothetical protein